MYKKIKNFENYSIDENGILINNLTNKILKQQISTSGYYCVQLVKNKKKYIKYIHRLVAETFLNNVKEQVDHINGNKLDNNVNNLRYVTAKENYYGYGYDNRRKSKNKKIIAKNNNKILIFNSRQEVAKYFECSDSKIKYDYLYKKGNKKNWLFKLKR